jgi:choline dehydrogenase-like flavoprotein
MPNKLPRTDVVVIGLGWTGAIVANELTEEGLDVVGIERGPCREGFQHQRRAGRTALQFAPRPRAAARAGDLHGTQ